MRFDFLRAFHTVYRKRLYVKEFFIRYSQEKIVRKKREQERKENMIRRRVNMQLKELELNSPLLIRPCNELT